MAFKVKNVAELLRDCKCSQKKSNLYFIYYYFFPNCILSTFYWIFQLQSHQTYSKRVPSGNAVQQHLYLHTEDLA